MTRLDEDLEGLLDVDSPLTTDELMRHLPDDLEVGILVYNGFIILVKSSIIVTNAKCISFFSYAHD